MVYLQGQGILSETPGVGGGGEVLPYISHIGIVNSRLANTPIIRTAAKLPGKNELQTFDLNKLPLLRTLANEDPNLRSLQCPL